jgi:hypothetical protein
LSDLEVAQISFCTEKFARRSDLGAIRPTRARKKPSEMEKTMVKEQIGAVLSNITKAHWGVVFCMSKIPQKDAKVVYVFSKN